MVDKWNFSEQKRKKQKNNNDELVKMTKIHVWLEDFINDNQDP